jgi:hypothetical protein
VVFPCLLIDYFNPSEMIDDTCEWVQDQPLAPAPEDEQSLEDQTHAGSRVSPAFPLNSEAEQSGKVFPRRRSFPPASIGSTHHGSVSPSYQTANGLAMKEKAGHNKPIAFPCRGSILVIEESRLPPVFSFLSESILLAHPLSVVSFSIPADSD